MRKSNSNQTIQSLFHSVFKTKTKQKRNDSFFRQVKRLLFSMLSLDGLFWNTVTFRANWIKSPVIANVYWSLGFIWYIYIHLIWSQFEILNENWSGRYHTACIIRLKLLPFIYEWTKLSLHYWPMNIEHCAWVQLRQINTTWIYGFLIPGVTMSLVLLFWLSYQ